MTEPERRRTQDLAPAERGKVLRSAASRPLNVMTLIAGLGISLTLQIWWLIPLTLVVYALVVYLASKDPVFARRSLGEKERKAAGRPRDVSPERRARWLPRGETREKVEAALVTYRKVAAAIEESDDVTKQVLEGAIPKLNEAADRLVDVADKRERAAQTLKDFRGRSADEQRESSLRRLESYVGKADAEISDISERFLTLRAQVVRASIDSAGAADRAAALNASLDDLNFRLEALNETFSRPGER